METQHIIKAQLDKYRPNYILHGNTPKGTYQNNTETQYLRFAQLISNFDIDGHSIHDIGSGIGDLHKYLADNNIKHIYIGTDIVPEMIDYSKDLYPECDFYTRDILEDKNIEISDYTVLSGTFNIPGESDRREWENFCYLMIDRMFEISRNAISFNCLTSFSTFRNPELVYFDPSKVLNYCLGKLSRFVVIEHNYALYEFTVTVFKDKFIAQKFSDDAFSKYFT